MKSRKIITTIIALTLVIFALGAYIFQLRNEILQMTSRKDTENNIPVRTKKACPPYTAYTVLATFDGNGWISDECSVWVPEELLLALPKQGGTIKIDKPENGLYLIQHVSESVDPIDDEALETTHRLFSKQEIILDESVSKFSYYVWSSSPFEANIEETTQQLPAKKLVEITSFYYWDTGMTWCLAELSIYDGIVDISCGRGDNACAIFHRVRIDIFNKSFEDRGVCANSCDLEPGETYKIVCGKDEIIPPWLAD